MSILRGVGSRVLPCGCLIGVYETYRGVTIGVVDATGPDCRIPSHRRNARLGWPIGESGQRLDPLNPESRAGGSRPTPA